jgi:hypothetical protein
VEESLWISSWFANARETGLEEINRDLLEADFWTTSSPHIRTASVQSTAVRPMKDRRRTDDFECFASTGVNTPMLDK